MYTSFFGLNEKPFAITPDPRYLYMSERHAEALAHLLYGINEAGGFVQLTGEVGTGKTTVIRSLLGQIPQSAPQGTEIALILNPHITPAELLLTLCEELHVAVPEYGRGSVKELVDALNRHLLAAHSRGQRVVVIIDEAQNLSTDVLEHVRLLTNLETPTQKLLQIILVGQPELRELLKRNDLRQLAQRITGRYHLVPLSTAETAGYVRHRLRVAGATTELFANSALREVHRLSKGIPRVINVLCDRALLGAYTQDRHRITGATVRRAVREIYGRPVLPAWSRWAAAGVIAAGALLLAFGAWRLNGPLTLLPAKADTKTQSTAGTGAGSATGTLAAATPSPAATPALGAMPTVGAKPPPSAPPPASPTLATLLAANAAETGMDSAFEILFGLWGARYQPFEPGTGNGDACEQATHQGLECLTQRGSWAQLRSLNRPAVLTLTDGAGNEHQMVLAQLDDERATFEIGGKRQALTIAEVSRYWFGDFLLLWRPAVAGAKQLSLGMHGEEVRRLRQGLEQARGVAPTQNNGTDVYDERLVKLVEDFQRDHRLTVDGIAGTQTQLMLDSMLGSPGTPLLTPPAVPAATHKSG